MGIAGEVPFSPDDKENLKDIETAFNETGIGLLDLELARIVDEVEPRVYLPALEVAAKWGAKHVIASAWTPSRDNRDFIIDRYAEICDLAKPLGLSVNLEFPSFSRLTDLQEAADIVRAADRSNGGILIDSLYFHFSRVGVDEIAALPVEWFNFMHVCDAGAEIPGTKEAMVHIARDERLYFGEGCIDFQSILERLPDIPLAIELPHAARVKQYGYEEHARRCLETAKHHLDPIDSASDARGDTSQNSPAN